MTAKEITESSLDNIRCTTLNYSFYHYHFIQLVIMSIHLRSQLCAYPSLSFLYLLSISVYPSQSFLSSLTRTSLCSFHPTAVSQARRPRHLNEQEAPESLAVACAASSSTISASSVTRYSGRRHHKRFDAVATQGSCSVPACGVCF